jgi:hypothetical protein
MKAQNRKQYAEAWNRHITELHRLACDAGNGDSRRWGEVEKELRDWVATASDKAFPEPTASGDLPSGVEA